MLTTSDALTAISGGEAEITAATMLRMYAEVHSGLRNDDALVSGYWMVRDTLTGLGAMAVEFGSDPIAFAGAHGQALTERLTDAVNQAGVDVSNALLRPLVLTNCCTVP